MDWQGQAVLAKQALPLTIPDPMEPVTHSSFSTKPVVDSLFTVGDT